MSSVVLAGGGTAGHTSPLIATAQALTKAQPEIKITCVGTARGLETRVIPDAGLKLELIPAVPLPRKINADLFKLPFRLYRAVKRAKQILREADADVMVGFGGYVSLPVYFAARQLKIPVVVHEQNMSPGIANKVAAKFAAKVFTVFPDVPLANSEAIGMPVRDQITELALAEDRTELAIKAREKFELPTDSKVLLVSGGSQGARSLNNATWQAKDELLAKNISILHVVGPKNFSSDLKAKTDPETGAKYQPVAFVDNMADAYAAADLMLARSGAGTVVETATIGLPTILVPLPIGNGEQALNAKPVSQAGAAVVIADEQLNSETLIKLVDEVLAKADQMSEAGKKLMPAGAADRLARQILELV